MAMKQEVTIGQLVHSPEVLLVEVCLQRLPQLEETVADLEVPDHLPEAVEVAETINRCSIPLDYPNFAIPLVEAYQLLPI